jgi:hypothetical protein
LTNISETLESRQRWSVLGDSTAWPTSTDEMGPRGAAGAGGPLRLVRDGVRSGRRDQGGVAAHARGSQRAGPAVGRFQTETAGTSHEMGRAAASELAWDRRALILRTRRQRDDVRPEAAAHRRPCGRDITFVPMAGRSPLGRGHARLWSGASGGGSRRLRSEGRTTVAVSGARVAVLPCVDAATEARSLRNDQQR